MEVVGGGGSEKKGKERERERRTAVEKVRETRAGDIPPAKGGLIGGGDESSASLSIVLSVAYATHFPTYARVDAARSSLPSSSARSQSRGTPRKTPLSFLPLSRPFRVIELHSIPLHRNGNARRYRPTVGDTLLRTEMGNVVDIDPWENAGINVGAILITADIRDACKMQAKLQEMFRRQREERSFGFLARIYSSYRESCSPTWR